MSVGTVHADGGLRIRAGPSTNNTIVGSMPNGAQVNVIGGSCQWWKVNYNGAVGYSHSSYISVQGRVTARSGLNIRSGPSTNNGVVSAIPFNKQVTIKKRESDGWFYVSYNGASGYSSSEYISLVEGSHEERRESVQPRMQAQSQRTITGVRVTGYYPSNDPMQGGFNDALGHKLSTLDDFRSGRRDYVSLAVDPKVIRLGTYVSISGFPGVRFYACDTGGAIKGSHVDVCASNRNECYRITTNGATVTIL